MVGPTYVRLFFFFSLVSFLQEFSTEDNADLFLEENLAKKQADEDKARQAQLAVPGLVNPHDLPEDDMADL